MNIYELLKAARIKQGMSQNELASRLGYTTPQFISNWERGMSLPPHDKLALLCTILKINRSQLRILLVKEYKIYLMKFF